MRLSEISRQYCGVSGVGVEWEGKWCFVGVCDGIQYTSFQSQCNLRVLLCFFFKEPLQAIRVCCMENYFTASFVWLWWFFPRYPGNNLYCQRQNWIDCLQFHVPPWRAGVKTTSDMKGAFVSLCLISPTLWPPPTGLQCAHQREFSQLHTLLRIVPV